jgi:O-succinylbenzoate synthase
VRHVSIDATLYRLDIPLLRPFDTASGSVSERTVGLVAVSRDDITGWGEASPFPGQDEPFVDVVDAAHKGTTTPSLTAALNQAVSDLRARERGVSLVSELGPTDATVPISVAIGLGEEAVLTAKDAWESGVKRFKIKIMPGRTSHVLDIRGLFPEAVIGIDANGSFDARTIPEILALGDVDVAFIEQPTRAVADPAVQKLHDAGFTVFVDESIRSVETAEKALAIPEVSGVVVKPGRLGWSGSVEVVRMARAAGKLWRASGLLESGVGRSFTLALAAADDAFVSDVAPASRFFAYDIAPQAVEDERLVVPTGPGTGLDVDTHIVQDQAVEVITLSGSAIPNLD